MESTKLTITIDIQHDEVKPNVLDLAKISGKAVKAITDEAKERGFKTNNLVITDKS